MKLTLKEKVAYGIGAVGKDMVYMLSASYVLYYFQDILGVNAIAMGIILMIARVFDAFNDPLMGIVVAKTQTKWGKFRPWLLIGTVTNAVILFVMFAAPPALNGKGLVAYAAITYILWGVTYTMMDIPYWSMIPAFTSGGKERENLSALARSCAGVGSAIITIITVMAVAALGNAVTNRSARTTIELDSAKDNITVYVIEVDEKDNPTGNVLDITGSDRNIKASLVASDMELQEGFIYSESNSDYTIDIGGFPIDKSISTMNFAMDSASAGEAAVTISVSSANFNEIKQKTGDIDISISSTKQVERYGFKYFALIVAIIFIVFTLITCIGIKEKSTVDMKTASVGEMFKALVQNDQAMTMVITIVLVNTATYIVSNLLIYFFKYDLGGTNWQGNYTLFNTFAGGMQIVAMMLFFPLLRKFFSTMKVFDIAIGSSVVGYIILLIMALFGVKNVYAFFVPCFFIMSSVGVLNVLVTVFLANTVDYGELKNNRRDESVIFSMQTFVVKLASGIAALVAAVSLAIFDISDSNALADMVDESCLKAVSDYINNIKNAGATVVGDSSVLGIRLVMTILPIAVLVIGFLLFKKKYILTDEKLSEIDTELKSRRGDAV